MKIRGSTLLKTLASVLCWVLIISIALVGTALWFAYDFGAYYDGGKVLIEEIGKEICYDFAKNVISHYENYHNGYVSETAESSFRSKFSPENTNLRFKVTDLEGNELYSTFGDADVNIGTKMTGGIVVNGYEFLREKYFTNMDRASEYIDELYLKYSVISIDTLENETGYPITVKAKVALFDHKNFDVEVGITKDLINVDYIYYVFGAASLLSENFDIVLCVLCAALLLLVLLLVFILYSSGRRKNGELHLGFFARLPLDLYSVLVLICINYIALVISEISRFNALCIILPLLIPAMFIGLLYSLGARLKNEKWFKNVLIFIVLQYAFKVIKYIIRYLISFLIKIPLIWKTGLICLCMFLLGILAVSAPRDDGILMWSVGISPVIAVIVKTALDMRKLEAHGEKIASGEFGAKIDRNRLIPSLRNHADSLNGIECGLKTALDERLKSERMKSELITNVSHDIKTPLTSIVNYVGLLSKEGLSSQNTQEYLNALERQSIRLKKLTEDLVEASKAASGSISFSPEITDVMISLNQAIGEYEERINEFGLELITRYENEELMIMADGKLLWRIFDNLLGNACKYSLKNTRVYVSEESDEKSVRITIKNISATPLNISSNELTERFVRGDSSRNTEGSGLGLSIAKSLTELQDGKLTAEIDGDLFKVTVEFKKC